MKLHEARWKQPALPSRDQSVYTYDSALVLLRAQHRAPVSTHKHTRSYSEVLDQDLDFTTGDISRVPEKPKYVSIRFESDLVIRMLVDIWYESRVVMSDNRILRIPKGATN
ncbi:hypothetical protein AYI70_g10385 [Smittium culicis]|uniref:Uncharacterized protein n=1 Tax=Smittium culicis TaxID=133412 RepID=A0A1R1X6T5_9FUNG|nr:hypothetical protein AYI70_g10385 [Smittium culicis]